MYTLVCIEIDPNQLGYASFDWSHVIQGTVQIWTYVNMIINFLYYITQ